MYVCMCIYVCIYSHHIYQSMDQPGKVVNLARDLLNGGNNLPLSPCVPENFVSRDGFSRPVPRHSADLYTQAESGASLRDSSRVPRRRPFKKKRHTPSGQSRVYRVTLLRTDGVHCRESAGTRPVNLMVLPNGCLKKNQSTPLDLLSIPRLWGYKCQNVCVGS